jgi:diadenosine tetraphosphate (Ap4A) HIT family hydrolase
MFGEVPAYNVAVRTGEAVGHLHAEIIPKTRTNVPAGFEETTLEYSLTELPERFAELAREESSSEGWD